MLAQTNNESSTQSDDSTPHHDERRRHRREFAPNQQLHLVVNHRELATINWSAGGCLVDALEHWKVGDTVAGTLESQNGVPMGAIISEIVRIDDQGRAALNFSTIEPLF